MEIREISISLNQKNYSEAASSSFLVLSISAIISLNKINIFVFFPEMYSLIVF